MKKFLIKVRNKVFGEPAKKYRIYRKGNGSYHVKYGEKYLACDRDGLGTTEFGIGCRRKFESLNQCEFLINDHRSRVAQYKQDNKITLVKEIA